MWWFGSVAGGVGSLDRYGCTIDKLSVVTGLPGSNLRLNRLAMHYVDQLLV